MSELNDLFHLGGSEPNRYLKVGFPSNPFREDQFHAGVASPFYTDYIKDELNAIQNWVNDVVLGQSYMPLSVVGTIGAGKSKIISVMKHRLQEVDPRVKILVDSLRITDGGYSRASVGGVLLSSLDTQESSLWSSAPDGVMPMVWSLVEAPKLPLESTSAVIRAVQIIRESRGDARLSRAKDLSTWLRRGALSPKRADDLQLNRRIDWEGELIKVICSLVKMAHAAGVLTAYFLFFDQLEDLFGPAFSDLRRSRLLTDLRSLIDEIDAGSPIGLMLSWSPDIRAVSSHFGVDREFSYRYGALYDRLQRRRIDLPYLSYEDAEPLARVAINAMAGLPGFNPAVQPSPATIAQKAWESLQERNRLLPRAQATPRILLGAMGDYVDELAE